MKTDRERKYCKSKDTRKGRERKRERERERERWIKKCTYTHGL